MPSLDRRAFLGASCGTAAAAAMAGPPWAGGAIAATPATGRQAPGFHRFKLGAFEVTVVSDGTLVIPTEVLWPTAPREEIGAVLAGEFLPLDQQVVQLNALVVNTGERLVLVDAGSGGKFQQTSGSLLGNLAAAGLRPEDVDTVLLTHAHPDHLWGVSDATGTRLLFPRAEYVLAGTERDFWTAPDLAGRMPDDLRTMVETTQQHLKTVAERVRTVTPGAEVVPGIATVDTAGHTPGHVSLHIVSGGEELLCTGDAISHPAVSFRQPDWHLGFDVDPEQGAKVRRGLLDRCATDRPRVASYHLPFPGVGHVARDGAAYRWVPSDWRWDL